MNRSYYDRITALIGSANKLEYDGDWQAAREQFLVAADLAEETGDDRARRLRGRANRILVAQAASQRWPEFDFTDIGAQTAPLATLGYVDMREEGRGEIFFRILLANDVRAYARVDRHGRVRWGRLR